MSAYPNCFAAAAESPPPITVIASGNSEIALHTSSVPLANLGISNTPIGPFHTTVLAPAKVSLNNSTDLGPISNPIHPSGICPASATLVLASSLNASAITLSTGRTNLSPAFSKYSFAKSNLSSSTNEVPIEPPTALENV